MRFNIELRDYNLIIQLEHCVLKIIDGNWGAFSHSFANHMHSYYELHYVSGGQGTLITPETNVPLKKGFLYLLPPKTNHEQLSASHHPLQEYHVAFELLHYSDADLIWRNLFSNGFYRDNLESIEPYFEYIALESTEKHYGYLDKIRNNLQDIFITMLRSATKSQDLQTQPVTTPDDKRIMLIDEAFLFRYQHLTLVALSDQLMLSTRQTQRFIYEKYGMTFTMLKSQSRMNHSAMLLSSTQLSLADICEEVGYRNYSFFGKAFKQLYHMTPSDYRKMRVDSDWISSAHSIDTPR